MILSLKKLLRGSIRARLIAVTSVTVLSIVCVLTWVIALVAANILRQESSWQQSQSLEQSVALLSNFLEVRDANLNLWASSPLVEAIFKDPALATVFTPSLRNYFAQAKAQEPWIAHIFLMRGTSVIYDDSDTFDFGEGEGDQQNKVSTKTKAGGLALLTSLPAEKVSVLNLRKISPKLDKVVVHMKRPFVRDGKAVPGAYIVLLLDFEQINRKLFGQIKIGQRGFISVVARSPAGQLFVPSMRGEFGDEKSDFLTASRQWAVLSDIPESYRSVDFKTKELLAQPFAIVGVASLNDIREAVLKLVYLSIAIGAFALLAGILSAFYSSARLIEPIQTLTATTERLAKERAVVGSSNLLNLAPEIEGTQNLDELERLANSFARMQKAIGDKINVIETQNEQLRQSERGMEELNRSLEVRVEQRTEELSATVQTLGETLSKLQATQNQLIHAEKMASLGQLVTNVAHEINTPIGAVKSSGDLISAALDEALANFPRLFQLLDSRSLELFMQLLTGAKRASAVLSTREERAIWKEVKKQLAVAGIDDADGKARILVALRATTNALEYLPLLRHQESHFILERAQSIGSIINSTKNIEAAVNRVSKMVTTLKSFSAVNTEDERIEADLKAGIEAALTQYAHQITGRIEVIRQYENLPLLVCLQDELKLVWMHLIHNALLAMDYVGILTIRLQRIGNEAVISVTDNGCGIAEEIRHRIFEAFFSTRPHGEGSGLGLDIVKKIVAKHRGRIEVQTEVGVGSTFSVYLPYPSLSSVVKTNEQSSDHPSS